MLLKKTFVSQLDWDSVAHYPHVGDVHVIDHEIIPESKQVKVRRIARVRYNLPSIVHYIVGTHAEYMLLEESLLDTREQSISIKTTGFTMTDRYRYEEDSSFQCTSEGKTRYDSVIDFRILGFGMFNSTLDSVTSKVAGEFTKNGALEMALQEAANSLNTG